jgi:hypothetical protein
MCSHSTNAWHMCTSPERHECVNLGSLAMAPPLLPLDVLLPIVDETIDDDGVRRFSDLNSFLQVNRALHDHLNPLLWHEAASSSKTTQRVLIHLLNTRKGASSIFSS